jgi:hypothetical protein
MSKVTSTLDNQESRVYQIGTNLVRNFIGDGFDISPNGLSVDITPGYCDIDGKYHETTETINQVLPPRSTGLIYAQKSTYSDCPQFGYVPAVLPDVDTNTVALWDFRNWDGSSPIVNSAVGVNGNTIAVANALTKGGTVSKVDGWLGYAAQGDGSTGYFSSANSTGFPTGSTEKEANALYTRNANSSSETIFSFGNSDASATFNVIVSATGEILVSTPSGSSVGTGYIMDAGRTYLVTHQHDGSYSYIYTNGILVAKVANAISPVAAVMQILRNVNNANYSKGVIHFIELRNKMRTSVQLGANANKLCLPCSYQTPSSPVPLMTSNNSQGCVASASSISSSSYMAYMAFRKGSVLGTNGWQGAAGTTGWLQITTPDSFIPKWVDLTAPDTANVSFSPKDFTIYGSSNGGTTKTTLLTVNGATGWKSNERRRFYILSASAYTTLGINVTSVDGGSYVMINDLDFGTDVVTTTDIRSILPANSNSFGIVRTNSLGVIDIDNKYRTGRREGASGGNRITFLDWKYFSAVNTPVSWNLPFGNADYKIHEIIVTDT